MRKIITRAHLNSLLKIQNYVFWQFSFQVAPCHRTRPSPPKKKMRKTKILKKNVEKWRWRVMVVVKAESGDGDSWIFFSFFGGTESLKWVGSSTPTRTRKKKRTPHGFVCFRLKCDFLMKTDTEQSKYAKRSIVYAIQTRFRAFFIWVELEVHFVNEMRNHLHKSQ